MSAWHNLQNNPKDLPPLRVLPNDLPPYFSKLVLVKWQNVDDYGVSTEVVALDRYIPEKKEWDIYKTKPEQWCEIPE